MKSKIIGTEITYQVEAKISKVWLKYGDHHYTIKEAKLSMKEYNQDRIEKIKLRIVKHEDTTYELQ